MQNIETHKNPMALDYDREKYLKEIQILLAISNRIKENKNSRLKKI